MNEEYYSILRKFDDPVRWENPEDFDYEKEQQNFFVAKDHLQCVLRQKLDFETGSHIQDASYHSMIKISGQLLKNPEDYAQVRFSNFGKMISFVNENCIKENIQIDIVQHLITLGYAYIPEKVLEEQYTGKNPGVSGIYTWWVRFFDWV
jgi:hypothetical protein